MTVISVSLWLPVGRANFYSVSANGWLKVPDTTSGDRFASRLLDDPDYVPIVQCSVLRRLLEVLPRSFGYERFGECQYADAEGEPEERSRPVSVMLTLIDLTVAGLAQDSPRYLANEALATAGISQVWLRVDEHGNYTFLANVAGAGAGADLTAARTALVAHACAVFGGGFQVNRLKPQEHRGVREGAAAVRRYNGLTEEPQPGSEQNLAIDVLGPPRGALTFFQLNTILEGICNLTLSPAVFFERYRFMHEFLGRTETANTVIETVGEFVGLVVTHEDGRQLRGQVNALRRFLAVTSRETLQKVKWSVESVRRNLLNEMMSVLHRQSRLVQLDLAAIRRERSPELASEASESQLRGYVTLVAAKLPIIANVYEMARLTADHLTAQRERTHEAVATAQLSIELDQWKLLLGGLDSNIRSLEVAVEQAWMERLLYEQQQARSEQEAISEIERSRYGQPAGRGPARSAYDSVNLIFTLLSVLFVVATTDPHDIRTAIDNADLRQLLPVLLPIAAVAAVLYLVIPGLMRFGRWRRERAGTSDRHNYEFAFVLDEPTAPDLIREHLLPRGRRRLRPPAGVKRLPGLSLTGLGGGRIERVSADSSSIKMHSVLTFRVAFMRYARFEVVHEILANRVSDEPRYLLHQIRVFGDSPVALRHETVALLIDTIHHTLEKPIASDERVDDPLSLLRVFY